MLVNEVYRGTPLANDFLQSRKNDSPPHYQQRFGVTIRRPDHRPFYPKKMKTTSRHGSYGQSERVSLLRVRLYLSKLTRRNACFTVPRDRLASYATDGLGDSFPVTPSFHLDFSRDFSRTQHSRTRDPRSYAESPDRARDRAQTN